MELNQLLRIQQIQRFATRLGAIGLFSDPHSDSEEAPSFSLLQTHPKSVSSTAIAHSNLVSTMKSFNNFWGPMNMAPSSAPATGHYLNIRVAPFSAGVPALSGILAGRPPLTERANFSGDRDALGEGAKLTLSR